ncbi:nitric-oxide synthase (NADPH) [Ranunculus cassubicifolius]
MAPKSLFSFSFSTSLSPFSLTHNPHNSLVQNLNKSTPIFFCKLQISTPITETSGTGAAAPTRGDVFLSRQQSIEAASITKPKKKPKKKPKISTDITCCYGCGAPLQIIQVDAPGYVHPPTYELKKKHKQLKTVLCRRCKLLSHGHMITAVGGNGGYSGGKQFVTADELRQKLAHLRDEKVLIVKLVDIVDFNGSFLARIRDLAGSNPIILVVTKVDLLPKGTNFNCVGDWVVEATTKKKLNVISVHLTSSKSLVGIAGVASEIQNEKKGRDVYILGAANVGKSAFINALLKMMSQKDLVAAAARKYKPIQSAVPGTTLGPIAIDAFIGDGKLYDTPGVHLHHRQAAVIHSEDLPSLAPQSRLKGRTFPVASDDLNGFSIFWGGLVRVDVLKVLPSTRLTFHGPKALQIHVVPTAEADAFYQKEVGVLLTPPSSKHRADDWAGLEISRDLRIKSENPRRPACDIAVSGLGWITVNSVDEPHESFSSEISEEVPGELHFVVHVPKPVEIFVRPPLPVGKSGEEWYEYRDLTEKEEELRPKWYF